MKPQHRTMEKAEELFAVVRGTRKKSERSTVGVLRLFETKSPSVRREIEREQRLAHERKKKERVSCVANEKRRLIRWKLEQKNVCCVGVGARGCETKRRAGQADQSKPLPDNAARQRRENGRRDGYR